MRIGSGGLGQSENCGLGEGVAPDSPREGRTGDLGQMRMAATGQPRCGATRGGELELLLGPAWGAESGGGHATDVTHGWGHPTPPCPPPPAPTVGDGVATCPSSCAGERLGRVQGPEPPEDSPTDRWGRRQHPQGQPWSHPRSCRR